MSDLKGNGPASQLFLGVMSGTSMDGADVSLIRLIDNQIQWIASESAAFGPALRDRLLALQYPASKAVPDPIATANELSVELAKRYAALVNQLLQRQELHSTQITAIGVHGQTIRHQPAKGYTVQLNQPAWVAELTDITVVADFRARDIAAGGQGAPLVPAFHDALYRSKQHAVAVLNLGGIANITLLPKSLEGEQVEPVYGYDVGPANLLLDAWIQRHRGEPFDHGGSWAAAGRVDTRLLQTFLSDDYFRLPAPKSTGRDHFDLAWVDRYATQLGYQIPPTDVQATLAELTAKTCAEAALHAGAKELLICGGGWRNQNLIDRLRRLLPEVLIAPTPLEPQWVESAAFAWLASRVLNNQPGNLASVTGAKGPRISGAIYPR